MSTAAILLIETTPLNRTSTGSGPAEVSGAIHGIPLPCIDVLGLSTLQRTMQRFADAGVTSFTILADAGLLKSSNLLTNIQPGWLVKINSFPEHSEIWPVVQACIENCFANQVEDVFLVRVSTYAEFHPDEVLKFAKESQFVPVRIHDRFGAVGTWLVNSSRPLSMESLCKEFQGRAQDPGIKTYFLDGYVNRLSGMRDFRRFVVDMFMSRCEARPQGSEVRSGVWVDAGAQIHRQARVVPPAYIGKNTKLGPASLITRSSSVEHDCNVEYGTVVEDSSVLACTYIGTGLDVLHSVVYGNTLVHLHQNMSMEINDEILIGTNVSSRLRKIFCGQNQLVPNETTKPRDEHHIQWKGML